MCTTTTWRFMMSRRKMRLYVDWDAAWAEDAESLARLPEPNGDGTGLLPSTEEAIALVHYVFRSSIILDTRAGRRELLKMTEFSRLCKSLAVRAGADAGFLAEPPLPSWARSTVNGLRSYLRPTYPQVDEIKVVATLDNRLHVRSFHSRHEIQISVITRAVLRTMNLMIWNHVEMASREPDPRTSAYSGPQLVDVFGFTLPLYRDIPWNQAPFLRAAGPLAAQQAIIGTRIQMAYMLAHEFGHLLLHEESEERQDLEAEVDRFAYDLILRWLSSSGTGSGEVWWATRWLREHLAIERAIVWRLAGLTEAPPLDQSGRTEVLRPFARVAAPTIDVLVAGGAGLRLLRALREEVERMSPGSLRRVALEWHRARDEFFSGVVPSRIVPFWSTVRSDGGEDANATT